MLKKPFKSTAIIPILTLLFSQSINAWPQQWGRSTGTNSSSSSRDKRDNAKDVVEDIMVLFLVISLLIAACIIIRCREAIRQDPNSIDLSRGNNGCGASVSVSSSLLGSPRSDAGGNFEERHEDSLNSAYP